MTPDIQALVDGVVADLAGAVQSFCPVGTSDADRRRLGAIIGEAARRILAAHLEGTL